jgi:two-component system response regulator YesN
MIQEIHVVVADDEPMIRRGIARLIEECGEQWKVLATFANGSEALDYMKNPEIRVDLLVTDVKMPIMDGLALIQEARKYQPLLPLVISGYDDFEYVRTALREGAIDYLLKPINRSLFRLQMKEIQHKIRRRKRQDEFGALQQWLYEGDSLGMTGNWRTAFLEKSYRLLCVSLDEPPLKTRTYTRRDWELSMYAVENILEETVDGAVLGQTGRGWVWQGGKRMCWILMGDAEGVDQLAESVRLNVLRYMGLSVTVSVSSEFTDMHSLPGVRDDVMSLLYLRLVYGGNRVIAADRMLAISESAIPVKLRQIVQRLRLEIGRESDGETKSLLDDYFREIESLNAPENIRHAVEYLILHIHGACLETGHEEEQTRILSNLAKIDQHTASFHQLRKQLDHLLLLVSASIREKRSKTDRTPVNRAKVWIKQHLGEPLTIQSIAEQIPMNPTYFCEIFKTHTGETVLNYVRRLRMEEAARLLIETDGKLLDITDKVGYNDVKYFSRQFKRHFGVLPSSYKDIAKPSAD